MELWLLSTLICIGISGIFDNHLWRIWLCVVVWTCRADCIYSTIAVVCPTLLLIWMMPMYANMFRKHKRQGCVLITGCDSGMGQATVVHLAKTNSTTNGNTKNGRYDQIFAGCYNAKQAQLEFEKLLSSEERAVVNCVQLNVTDENSVATTIDKIKTYCTEKGSQLTGFIQFHGIAYFGPAQYLSMDMYETQYKVNCLGTLRVVQACLPLLRQASESSPDVFPRIVLTGTGGGPCSPCPPLLTAYMSSKFALEAYCHALRQEMYMTGTRIEVTMINPGFVKPTLLMENGKKNTTAFWASLPDTTRDTAKKEYGVMMDHFLEYSVLQPGTHVSKICDAAEHALSAPVPRTSYKVGIDSKLAPIVGMMPTGMRETIARHGIYGVLSPAGTVKGYQV